MKILILAMLGIVTSPDIENYIDKTSDKIKSTDTRLLVNWNGYEELSWDLLLSDKELEFYLEEMAFYRENPEYKGRKAPEPAINNKINGKRVKIPGYPIAVDTEAGVLNHAKTFLFVPTAGACIHIPPPPANQTIFVEMEKSIKIDPYQPIYVEGTIITEEGDNGFGTYFYKIKGDRIKKYK